MKKLILVLSLSVFATVQFAGSESFAQQQGGEQQTTKKVSGPRRQLATIVFAGLGGAVLGLSTLSFYGRPQEHLSNIAVGFAVGVIAGTVMVTYKTASTREYYEDDGPPPEIKEGGAKASEPLKAFQVAQVTSEQIESSERAPSVMIEPDISLGNLGSANPRDELKAPRVGARVAIPF